MWGVVVYLFYGYFHPIPKSEHHLTIKPNSHILNHEPPQLFIKLRKGEISGLQLTHHAPNRVRMLSR